jgi:hypothetical protein
MAEMRAGQLKEDLQALRVLGDEVASRVLAGLPPGLLRTIERSPRADWLPIQLLLTFCHVVAAEVGDAGLRAWFRAATCRAVETSTLRPLMETVVRIFGLSPAALLRGAPQGWRATFRDCGELSVVRGEVAIVWLRGLPEPFHDRTFQVAMAGTFEALLQLSRTEGQVDLLEPSGGADAQYAMRWRDA